MTTQRRALVAANWKMNGSLTGNEDWVAGFVPKAADLRCDVVVCAPFVYLCTLARALAPAEISHAKTPTFAIASAMTTHGTRR